MENFILVRQIFLKKHMKKLFKEKEENVKKLKKESLCDQCINMSCIFQSGIIREKCDFYIDKSSVQSKQITCEGCRHIRSYDTDFPCSVCTRREKDYYERKE